MSRMFNEVLSGLIEVNWHNKPVWNLFSSNFSACLRTCWKRSGFTLRSSLTEEKTLIWSSPLKPESSQTDSNTRWPQETGVMSKKLTRPEPECHRWEQLPAGLCVKLVKEQCNVHSPHMLSFYQLNWRASVCWNNEIFNPESCPHSWAGRPLHGSVLLKFSHCVRAYIQI